MNRKGNIADFFTESLIVLAGTCGYMYACNLGERMGFNDYGLMKEVGDYTTLVAVGGLILYTLSSLQGRADMRSRNRTD